MARVDITLNGRPYTVACEDGQEPRLQELARYVDGKLREAARRAPASAGDDQLLVLAALMLADEAFDLQSELNAGGGGAPAPADDAAVVEAVDHLARRIEAIAARLERS